MAAELKSASTNQILRLTSKVFIATVAVYWLRSSDFGILPTILFIGLISIFYIKPPIHAKQFLPSALVLMALPFFIPRATGIEEIFIVLGWGILLLLVFGIKNVVLLKRKEVHYLTHLIIIAILTSLFFVGFNFFFKLKDAFFFEGFFFFDFFPTLFTDFFLNFFGATFFFFDFFVGIVRFLGILSIL